MAGAFLDRVSNKALGQLLVEKGALTSAQVEEALNVSKAEGIRLGEALVSLGYISRDALGYAIGEQYGLKPMELHPSMVDPELVSQFDPDLLRNHLMLPLIQIGDELVVVVSDPNDQGGLARLAADNPQLQVTPQLGAADQIKRCLLALVDKTEPLRSKVPTGSVNLQKVSDGPTPSVVNESFFRWLANQSAINYPATLQVRKSGSSLLVTKRPITEASTETPFELATLATLEWPGEAKLQQGFNRYATPVDFTGNRIAEWNELLEYNDDLYQILVYNLGLGRPGIYIIRAFQVSGLNQTAASSKLTSGQITLVEYSGRQELEDGIKLLLSSVGKNQITLNSRATSSRHYPAVLNLPAPASNMAAAMLFAQGTCAVWDWVPEADDVARVLSCINPPPAVFIWQDKNLESLPGVLEIQRRFDLQRVDVSELANYLTGGAN